MKSYNLWVCGVTFGVAASALFIGDYATACASGLLAVVTFFSWKTVKW